MRKGTKLTRENFVVVFGFFRAVVIRGRKGADGGGGEDATLKTERMIPDRFCYPVFFVSSFSRGVVPDSIPPGANLTGDGESYPASHHRPPNAPYNTAGGAGFGEECGGDIISTHRNLPA